MAVKKGTSSRKRTASKPKPEPAPVVTEAKKVEEAAAVGITQPKVDVKPKETVVKPLSGKVKLEFVRTPGFRYYNDSIIGRLDSGDVVEVDPDHAAIMLRDYPKNFVETGKAQRRLGTNKMMDPENPNYKEK